MVFLDFSQFFWLFDTPDTPVFADNQYENEILQQIEAIPPSVIVWPDWAAINVKLFWRDHNKP